MENEKGEPVAVMAFAFVDQPGAGADTFVTLGLSRWALDQGDGTRIRQELVAAADRRDAGRLRPVVQGVAHGMLGSGDSLRDGQVLGPAGPLFESSSLEAFYCTSPRVFPETFEVFRHSEPPTAFMWLIPITGREAAFVAAQGWRRFEEELEERDPDVFDLRRRSFL